jgi:hypothetical protein
MQRNEKSCDSSTGNKEETWDGWAEIMLALACLLTLAWIGFTLWIAGEVLGVF